MNNLLFVLITSFSFCTSFCFALSEASLDNLTFELNQQAENLANEESSATDLQLSKENVNEYFRVREKSIKRALKFINLARENLKSGKNLIGKGQEYFYLKAEGFFNFSKKIEEDLKKLNNKYSVFIDNLKKKKQSQTKTLKNFQKVPGFISQLQQKGFIFGDKLVSSTDSDLIQFEKQSSIEAMINKGKSSEAEKKIMLLEQAVSEASINEKFCKLKFDRLNDELGKMENVENFLPRLKELSDLIYDKKDFLKANSLMNELFLSLNKK